MDDEQKRKNNQAPGPDHPSAWSRPASWLRVPPTRSEIPPPIVTRRQLLPVDSLGWENFERLCLRLLELESDAVHVSVPSRAEVSTTPKVGLYGLQGQSQFGIDVYARDRLILGEAPLKRKYTCLQARRIKDVTAAALTSSVSDFLEGRWAEVSRKFVYATSASTKSTGLIDEIERHADKLLEQSIELTVWDKEEISKQLKDKPELVDDFFGRPLGKGVLRRPCS